jgi:hypothetical protein
MSDIVITIKSMKYLVVYTSPHFGLLAVRKARLKSEEPVDAGPVNENER